MRSACVLAALVACNSDGGQVAPAIRFLHTFGPEETELFNTVMAERGIAVDSSLVPFARGQQVIGEILRAGGAACPDLIRIDATWLASFARGGLLAPVPASLAGLDWTPEAAALVTPLPGGDGATYAIPQAVDGLVVIRDESRPAPGGKPVPTVDDLVEAARATRTQSTRYPLGLRADGYWFLAWLRAAGGELSFATDAAAGARALAAFAALYGDVVPPPPPAGGEAPHELRRWQAHDIAYWITGPWQIGVLSERERLAVSPLAHAPRGGQLLVVPRCARRPDDGWRLAKDLVEPGVAGTFANAFTTVPSRRSTLEASGPLVRAIYAALVTAEPLPRAPATPFLFDDLNPAIAAVIAGDATPDEAIAGVHRGWQRLAAALAGGHK